VTGVVTILSEQQVGALKTIAEIPLALPGEQCRRRYGFYLYKGLGLSIYRP
jgi:hypothetical protein